jgi:hypothetical protein
MSGPPQVADPTPQPPKVARFLVWQRRILSFCFVVFTLELGVFLLVFPWLEYWDLNWVPLQGPAWRDLWMNNYFRGALSGLGLLNLWVGFVELLRQIRALFQR